MSFFYFFPRCGGLGLIDEAGLVNRFARPPVTTEVVAESNGPQGLPGCVFHVGTTSYVPPGLTWAKAKYKPACEWWLGWDAGRIPGPNELARGLSLTWEGGVTLADGKTWRVPLLLPCRMRDARRECGLPQIYGFSRREDGDPRLTDPVYEPLLQRAALFLEAFEGRAESPPPPETFEFCAALLGVGYRIGPEELLRLRLMTVEQGERIINIAIDAAERVAAKAFESVGNANGAGA